MWYFLSPVSPGNGKKPFKGNRCVGRYCHWSCRGKGVALSWGTAWSGHGYTVIGMLHFNFEKNCAVSLNMVLLYFLELGREWAPAVINSPVEENLLRQAQKFPFVNDRSYWIGGSTNIRHLQNFGLSDYRTDDDGNILLYMKVLGLCAFTFTITL